MRRIVAIGEAFGKEEADAYRRTGRACPFIGAAGRELNRLMEEAGLLPAGTSYALNRDLWRGIYSSRDAAFEAAGIYLTNVFNEQPKGNRIPEFCQKERVDGLPGIKAGQYIRREYYHHLERLRNELIERKPNLIIGLGATASWFALGTGTITKIRGAITASNYGKFLPTFHPAYLFRDSWHLRSIIVFDLIKAAREAAYPEVRRPERFIYIPESIDDIIKIIPEISQSARLSIDIETVADQITCIGFAWTTQHCLVVPIFDHRRETRSYWSANEEPHVWRLIKRICGLQMPKVFQNGLFDLHFLWRRYGITVANCQDDTMLLHHALQPEVQKGLGFLGSIYSNESSWKLMRGKGKGSTLKDAREE